MLKRCLLSYALLIALIMSAILPSVPARASGVAAPQLAEMQAPTLQEEFPRPERPIHNGEDAVTVEIVGSNLKGLAVSYQFPEPQFWKTEKSKETFVEMAIPGMEQANGPLGRPSIPFYSRLLALPKGASVAVGNVTTKERDAVDGVIFPVQHEAVDAREGQEDDEFPYQDFVDPHFEIDEEYYASEAVYPPEIVTVEPIGSMGSLNLARVSVATGRYSTQKKQIQAFESVNYQLNFEGGEEYFLDKIDLSSFNRPNSAATGLLLNRAAVFEFIGDITIVPICIGHEYLIITDPALLSAAQDLRDAKVAAGISTKIAQTGNGAGQAGTTTTEIKDYIQTEYDKDCWVQLKYVLLLGDAELIPPWYNRMYYDDTPGSDLEYTLLENSTILGVSIPDLISDVALGRIPVDDLSQANTVVGKIINYEQSPPTKASFYEDTTIASYFQCCEPTTDFYIPPFFTIPLPIDGVAVRSFTETSELIRDELRSEGYRSKRIYVTDDKYHDDPTKPDKFYDAASRDLTPRYYHNLAPLPDFIGPGGGYAWDGSTSEIIDEINDGSFLVIHRDHGAVTGWGSPSFRTWDHAGLTNGDLTPVIYSINCASGLFDNETRNPANDAATYNTTNSGVYWAEDILRLTEGGAVAVIGDTRNSPTWANSALLRGLTDATWPGIVPEGSNDSITRMGDILNYGKLYLLGQIGVSQTAGSISTAAAEGDVLMYHLFGDPAMEMWTENPNPFAWVGEFEFERVTKRTWTFSYALEDVTITAMQGETPLSRGFVTEGQATLQMIGTRERGTPVTFVATHPNGIDRVLPLEQISESVTPKEGGKLSNLKGQFSMTFPENAVSSETEIVSSIILTETKALIPNHTTLRQVTVNAADPDDNEVTKFEKPFTLQLCADDDQQKELDNAFIAFFDEEKAEWVKLRSVVDETAGCVSTEVDHLTQFGLFRDELGSLNSGTNEVYLPLMVQ